MTEAPRPPGDGPSGPDPAGPPPSYSVPDPNPGYAPPPPPPGAAPPPPGGYGPPPGYVSGPAPVGFASQEDKTWALVAHFGGAAGMFIGAGGGGWVAPLIALLAKGNQSPAVRAHAVAALNFQLLWSIVGVVGWITACLVIGIFGILAAMAMGIIFGIIAGLKANEGQLYRYPATVNMIK